MTVSGLDDFVPDASLPDGLRTAHVDVYSRGTRSWDEARRLFDASLVRDPAVVYRPRSLPSAIELVTQLQNRRVPHTIKSGGHSAAGLSVRDGVPLVDLSALRRVQVNPDAATATLEGGARLGDLDAATSPFHLATTGGTVSSTGVVGLACGGGLGWLMGRFGLACDNILAATIVSDGEISVVDESSPRLRQLRGAGTSLGFIAELTLQLYPVESQFAYREIVVPRHLTLNAIDLLEDGMAALPQHVGCSLTIASGPSGDLTTVFELVSPAASPEALHWRAPLLSAAARTREFTLAYPDVQRVLDAQFPFGQRSYRRSLCFDSFATIDLRALLASLQAPSPFRRSVTFDVMHHLAADPARSEWSCFARNQYVALLVSRWPTADLDVPGRAAGRAMLEVLTPTPRSARATYGNYSSEPSDSAASRY